MTYLYTDRLEVATPALCQLSINYKLPRLQAICEEKIASIPPSTMSENFRNAVGNKSYSDIILVAGEGGGKVFAHRAILQSRCSFFKALFDSGMRDANEKELVLQGVPSDTCLRLCLEFLYIDQVFNLEPDQAIELLSVASLLNLPRLTALCESVIMKGVDSETVAYVYKTARIFQATKLIAFCVEVIRLEFEQVKKSESFQLLTEQEKEAIWK